ncbi:ABC transporter ATP-binding protein [Fumia xinanensis]|uniref:ABC transporter ATP-binding protein n=1 Tax=Fumia xinanensis TaxID=2763659 RepID=A0A926E3Q8_9FIRM|nr:ABC transporter ATP-binding protein [Fumia xinanensis]MBC8560502.1 ABC transporter ATP-binding protein [Fumia xinanensis]
MIQINQVEKRFGNVKALDRIDMEIQKGSIYGLVGSNGAGKSTLLRLIAGVYSPDSGSVSVESEKIFENPERKQRVFLVSDEPYFIGQYTLHNMADFYCRFYPKFNVALYKELCELFHLPADKKIATYSKGMKRQSAFLLGLSTMPDYLLLDECFDGLDPVKRQVVRKVLSDAMAERQMTAIISSHNLRELDEICDTVGILHKGDLLYSKQLDDLKGEVHKIQVVFSADISEEQLARTVSLMSYQATGRFLTLIAKGSLPEIEERLDLLEPLALEALPLTLEEVFLYEMEVKGYDANVIFR